MYPHQVCYLLAGTRITIDLPHYRNDLLSDWGFSCQVCSECFDIIAAMEVTKNSTPVDMLNLIFRFDACM